MQWKNFKKIAIMKFDLQKSEIQKIAAEHNYTVNNVEKVIRLSFILDVFVERTIRISPLFYNIFPKR